MTKDLALLIGPDQPWMTTEQFFEAIARTSKPRWAAGGKYASRREFGTQPERLPSPLVLPVVDRAWRQGKPRDRQGPFWPAGDPAMR